MASVQLGLAPRPHLRREWCGARPPGRRWCRWCAGGDGGHRALDGRGRGGEHQALPHVRRPHREGRRLRADDVQAVQARLLLVLPRVPGCKLQSKMMPRRNNEGEMKENQMNIIQTFRTPCFL